MPAGPGGLSRLHSTYQASPLCRPESPAEPTSIRAPGSCGKKILGEGWPAISYSDSNTFTWLDP